MERLVAELFANPEELLPEATIVETGKAYPEKKAKPLVERSVKVLRYVYSDFLTFSIVLSNYRNHTAGNAAEMSI